MSEEPSDRTSTADDEASEAGATSEGFGTLSVEDDAEGTTNRLTWRARVGRITTRSTTRGRSIWAACRLRKRSLAAEAVMVSEQSISPRDPDDAMARQSGAVSEDVQPVATDEKADTTAQGQPARHGGAGGYGARRRPADRVVRRRSVITRFISGRSASVRAVLEDPAPRVGPPLDLTQGCGKTRCLTGDPVPPPCGGRHVRVGLRPVRGVVDCETAGRARSA